MTEKKARPRAAGWGIIQVDRASRLSSGDRSVVSFEDRIIAKSNGESMNTKNAQNLSPAIFPSADRHLSNLNARIEEKNQLTKNTRNQSDSGISADSRRYEIDADAQMTESLAACNRTVQARYETDADGQMTDTKARPRAAGWGMIRGQVNRASSGDSAISFEERIIAKSNGDSMNTKNAQNLSPASPPSADLRLANLNARIEAKNRRNAISKTQGQPTGRLDDVAYNENGSIVCQYVGRHHETEGDWEEEGGGFSQSSNTKATVDEFNARIAATSERVLRRRHSGTGLGSADVDEQAPHLNRLLFRSRSRVSLRFRLAGRRRRRRRNNENGETHPVEQVVSGSDNMFEENREVLTAPHSRRGSNDSESSPAAFASHNLLREANCGSLIEATLVEDVELGEVFVAEQLSFMERKWKTFAFATSTFLLAILATSLIVFTLDRGEESVAVLVAVKPTPSPTFDPRPTLEMVKERRYIRCGLKAEMCRSVAAVIFGDPDSFKGVPTTYDNRWQQLLDRTVDLVILGDTHTIEREFRERTTGSGFTFSSTYNYDGMVYIGNPIYVYCAEETKRFDECANLMICVESGTIYHDYLRNAWPFNYFAVGSSLTELTEMLYNSTCNVIVTEKSLIQDAVELNAGISREEFIVGTKMMTKEPYGIITRNTDREFSDIVNWVVQALFFGEEQGMTKDSTLCLKYKNLTSHGISKLDFMNAIYCVGNYGELFDGTPWDRGMNQMNNNTGMLYATPFGNLGSDTVVGSATGGMLAEIMDKKSLTCGVVVPDGFQGMVAESERLEGMGIEYYFSKIGGLVGIGVDYCRALAAAIFVGDFGELNYITYPESDNSSFVALANRTIDVLAGGQIQRKYDFDISSMGGLQFSTPYYYGNESFRDDVSLYSMATREDDAMFSSFVNCIVMGTIHAQENMITRESYKSMPLTFVFGMELSWALRDAIAYSGSYDQIYTKNFGSELTEEQRGRNALNRGGPLQLSFPHFPS